MKLFYSTALVIITVSACYSQENEANKLSLKKSCDNLSKKFDIKIINEDNRILNRKLIFSTKEKNIEYIFKSISSILGCEFKKDKNQENYIVQKNSKEATWEYDFKYNYRLFENRSRVYTSKIIFNDIVNQLKINNHSEYENALLSLFDPADWKKMADSTAFGIADKNNSLIANQIDSLRSIPYNNLNPIIKENIFKKYDVNSKFGKRLFEEIEKSNVNLSLKYGSNPDIGFLRSPTSDGVKLKSGLSLFSPLSINNNANIRNDYLAKLIKDYMNANILPIDALLNINITKSFYTIQPSESAMPGIKPGIYSRNSAMRKIALLLKKDYFSDYFTDDKTIELLYGTVSQQLKQISMHFNSVISIDDKKILMRYINFTEMSLYEADYPIFENAISQKNTKGKLKPDMLFRLCNLDEKKFLKIARYNDVDKINFEELLNLIHYSNSTIPTFKIFGMLDLIDSKLLISKNGILVKDLPDSLQDIIRSHFAVRSDLRGEKIPEGARLCIQHLIDGNDDETFDNGWCLLVICPGILPSPIILYQIDADFSDFK